MDAFAIAVCLGLSMGKSKFKEMLTVGLYFGVSQALMPLIGYYLGSRFASNISSIDHWVSFVSLAAIGAKMIIESLKKDAPLTDVSLRFSRMLPLAAATSIDAFAVGISFSFLNVNIFSSAGIIGCVTLVLSTIGVWVGNIFGTKFKSKAELIGGIILIAIGTKILIEHLIG